MYCVQIQQDDDSWKIVSKHTQLIDAQRQKQIYIDSGVDAGKIKLGRINSDGSTTDL